MKNCGVPIPPVVLLDIEGTTTSISFVKDVLFPYARKELENFLIKNWDADEVQKILCLVKVHSESDVKEGLLHTPLRNPVEKNDKQQLIKSFVENLFWQMDNDRKTTGLKELQGIIWRDGYLAGVLKGHVYDDVPNALEHWVNSGSKIYIFSSGSVQAQILLFKHSVAGDLTKYLSGYFDTTTGPKVEAESYIKIASKIGVIPKDILFLTDVTKEAYAANFTGMNVVVMIRPGNAPLTSTELDELETSSSFEEFIYDKTKLPEPDLET